MPTTQKLNDEIPTMGGTMRIVALWRGASTNRSVVLEDEYKRRWIVHHKVGTNITRRHKIIPFEWNYVPDNARTVPGFDPRQHRLDRENDCCACGGMWVYYEPYDGSTPLPGVYGCERQGHENASFWNKGRDTNDRLIDAAGEY